jgi:hypothetical protein
MKDFLKAMCIVLLVLGAAAAALLILKRCSSRNYLTVEE